MNLIPIENRDALLAQAVASAMRWPGTQIGYFAPSYNVISRAVYPELEQLVAECERWGVRGTLDRLHMLFKFPNGSQIAFIPTDGPRVIAMGTDFTDICLDGVDESHERLPHILSRARGRREAESNQAFIYRW